MSNQFEPMSVDVGGAEPSQPQRERTYALRARKTRRQGRSGRMTLQQYQLTPTTRLPQELIYGAIRVADAPFVSHQRVVFSSARAWQEHVASRRIGEVIIAPADV